MNNQDTSENNLMYLNVPETRAIPALAGVLEELAHHV
jgi:hypothetical protein